MDATSRPSGEPRSADAISGFSNTLLFPAGIIPPQTAVVQDNRAQQQS
jgi:hypothetical protein